MRFIDGPDLGTRLAISGTMAPKEVARILAPIADAVDYAHQRGVIHRDLKPSNILLDSGGRPYLTDFGLGMRTQDGVDEASTPGIVIGTLEYMAPEMFTNGGRTPITPAIDIYALGCVAYTCLAGHSPFRADTPEKTMDAHLNQPIPSLMMTRPDIPPAIDGALARALAVAPADRYATAAELIPAIESAARSEETGPIPPLPPARSLVERARAWARAHSPVAIAGSVLGAIVVLVFALSVFGGGGGTTPTPRPSQGDAFTPRPTATERPTPQPTATPPPTPTPFVDPNAYPNAAEQRLLDKLPNIAGAAVNCRRDQKPWTGAVASLVCDPPSDGDPQLYYGLFPDKTGLDKTFNQLMAFDKVKPRTAPCPDPGSGTWDYVKDQPAEGQLACYKTAATTGESMKYAWTYDRTLILAAWIAPTPDAGLTFWGDWANGSKPAGQ